MLGIEPIEDLTPENPLEEPAEVPIPETLPADPEEVPGQENLPPDPEEVLGQENLPPDPESIFNAVVVAFVELTDRLGPINWPAQEAELLLQVRELFTSLTLEEHASLLSLIAEDGEIAEQEWHLIALIVNFTTVPEQFAILERFDAAVADGTIPHDLSIADDFWERQDTPFNCAVVAQKMILDTLGIPTSEAMLTVRAMLDGTLTIEGMPPHYTGQILEQHGVAVDHMLNTTGAELEEKLEAGHGVLVAVDADEIWNRTDDDDSDGGYGADHAVWLLEIDRSDPDNPVAVMNDSGTPDGAERRVPLHIFMDAFADGGNHAIVTEEPLEQLRQAATT